MQNPEASIRGSQPRTLNSESRASALLRLKLLGANPAAKVSGAEELPGKANYFIGNDPKKWRTNVPTYAKVSYKDVYPGVDLLYYGNQSGQLEYDFVVAPGADASAIALDVAAGLSRHLSGKNGGVKPPLQIAADGDLVIPTEGGQLRFHKPVAYQEQDSGVRIQDSGAADPQQGATNNRKSRITNRKSVEARFVLDAQNRVQFALGPYGHTQPLLIDPVLVYSTYLGGSQPDGARGIAVDSSGNAYVIGWGASSDFPLVGTPKPPLPASKPGRVNTFVAKLNATGSALVYSTYLGGNAYDWGSGIAVDSSGNAYVSESTMSSDFPTAQPVQASLVGGQDAFVAKLHWDTSTSTLSLVYSTYLGGNDWDEGHGIALDSSGNAYVTGLTYSTNFPTAHPVQADLGGSYAQNAFVAKISPSSDFRIWACSNSLTVRAGGMTICQISLASVDKFTGSVALPYSGLPPRSTCLIYPKSFWLKPCGIEHSTAFIATSGKTPRGRYTLTFTGALGNCARATTGTEYNSTSVTLIVK